MKNQLEPMLKNYVVKELKGEHPFLRLRACWMYGKLYQISF
jgi:cell division ATPase FtsA